MFLSTPIELWTDAMRKSVKGNLDPVSCLLRPLCGWQRSGNLWGKHLADTLKTMKSEDDRARENRESIELQAISI